MSNANYSPIIWLVAAFAVLAAPSPAALADVQVAFSPDNLSLEVGESARVEVVLLGVPPEGLTAFQLELVYDPWVVDVWNPNEAFRGSVAPFAPLGADPAQCNLVRGTSSCPDPVWMLDSSGRSVLGADEVDGSSGSIRLAYATHGQGSPVEGDGTIAIIEVSATADGDYAIDATGIVIANGLRPPSALGVTTSPLWISVAFPNEAPRLDFIGDQFVNEGEFLDTFVSANDPNGNDVMLEATGLPPFCQFDDGGGGFGTLQCSPGFTDAGTYAVTVVATDDGSPSASDSETFDIIVAEVAFCNDQDGDGFGDPGDPSCPGGDAPDCDDNDFQVNANAPERCRSGVDDNCDGFADGEDPACASPVCLLISIDGGGSAVLSLAPAALCPAAGVLGQTMDTLWGDLAALRDSGAEITLDDAQPVGCDSTADTYLFDNLLPVAGAVDFFLAGPAGQESYGDSTSGLPRRPATQVCP
jgi:hypothetical protein